MAYFRCNSCNAVYQDYYPTDGNCLMCNRGTITIETSTTYTLSTKIVDNPVSTVDMFPKCHMESAALPVCTENRHTSN